MAPSITRHFCTVKSKTTKHSENGEKRAKKMENAKIQPTIDGKPSPAAKTPPPNLKPGGKNYHMRNFNKQAKKREGEKKFCPGPRTPSEERAWQEMNRQPEQREKEQPQAANEAARPRTGKM